jgi:hypothetical protein
MRNQRALMSIEAGKVNDRFDKIAQGLRMNFPSNSLAPSKMYRLLAGIEEQRNQALDGLNKNIMGGLDTSAAERMNQARVDSANMLGMEDNQFRREDMGLRRQTAEMAAWAAANKPLDPNKDPNLIESREFRTTLESMFGKDTELKSAAEQIAATQGSVFMGEDGQPMGVAQRAETAGRIARALKNAGVPPGQFARLEKGPVGGGDLSTAKQWDMASGVGGTISAMTRALLMSDDGYVATDRAGKEFPIYLSKLKPEDRSTLAWYMQQLKQNPENGAR